MSVLKSLADSCFMNVRKQLMRACFVFSLVVGFASSLAAQSIDAPTSNDNLSGSIKVADLPLPDAQFSSPSNKLLRNNETWALRFPDEVDHKGSKIDKDKQLTFFSEGKFLPASSTNAKLTVSPIPIVEQTQHVGHPWWIDWPSTNLHNKIRPAVRIYSAPPAILQPSR